MYYVCCTFSKRMYVVLALATTMCYNECVVCNHVMSVEVEVSVQLK